MSDVQKVVRASAFELVDSKGRIRARLGFLEGFPLLQMLDEDGIVRVEVGMEPVYEEKPDYGFATITLADASGAGRVWMRVDPAGFINLAGVPHSKSNLSPMTVEGCQEVEAETLKQREALLAKRAKQAQRVARVQRASEAVGQGTSRTPGEPESAPELAAASAK